MRIFNEPFLDVAVVLVDAGGIITEDHAGAGGGGGGDTAGGRDPPNPLLGVERPRVPPDLPAAVNLLRHHTATLKLKKKIL